ncbi:hypothetical protein GW17_00038457 [Ensete ventricosum]|nr:hypothetical protein GW17_00038457 [Ensete ventricosum]
MGLFRLVTGLPGPSGFGSASTAEQVTDGIDASHLTVIITGASPAPIFFVPLSTALSSAVPLMAVRLKLRPCCLFAGVLKLLTFIFWKNVPQVCYAC